MIWQRGELFRNILIKSPFKFFIDRFFYPFIYFNLESLAYDIPESLKKVPLLVEASRQKLSSALPLSEPGTVGVADGSFYLNSIHIGLTRVANSKTKCGTISSFLHKL